MRVGINSCLWTPSPTTHMVAELATRTRAAGGDWLELPIYADSAELDCRAARMILEDCAVGVSVVTALWPTEDLIDAEITVSRRGVDALKSCIESAAILGAPLLSGAFYSAPGRLQWSSPLQRSQIVERLCERLTELADFAAHHAVTICIEPLNRYETSVLNSTEQALEVVRRVGHPNCGVLLDTFHMNIEEASIGAAIRSAGPWLRHLHANENHRGSPGTGSIDWVEVRDALRAVQFDGAMVIESFDFLNEEVARGGHCWRPIAPSADALARDGIGFLRELMSS